MSCLFLYAVRKLTFTWNKKKEEQQKKEIERANKAKLPTKSSVQNCFKLLCQEGTKNYSTIVFMTEKINSHANLKYCRSGKSWGLHTEGEYESTYFTLAISIIIFCRLFLKKNQKVETHHHM